MTKCLNSKLRYTWFSLWTALVAAGCPSSKPAAETTALPFEGVTLKLLVVDDSGLATAASQFQGEWKAQTGATFEVVQCTGEELFERPAVAADALLYPSHRLGALVQRQWVTPLEKDLLDDARVAWSQTFEALRLREAVRDGKTYAVPFGSPALVCYYRADLLERYKLQPPRTWQEYQKLVEFFQEPDRLAEIAGAQKEHWTPTCEPLDDQWRGLMLLARGATYAKHPDYFSAIFQTDTMKPLIDSPPFVRALEEMVRAYRGQELRWLTPQQVRQAFWQGNCALAVTWPSAAEKAQPGAAGEGWKIGFCDLPGGSQVFNPETRKWETRGKTAASVPLLGIAGRLGSVASDSKQKQAAFELLAALSGPQWSPQVSTASSATTLFRTSHLQAPRQWVERPIDQAAAREYATLASEVLARHDYVPALLLPGREQYLAALDQAVAAALRGEQSPAEALTACADKWESITESIGRQTQQAIYRQSVVPAP